eukprot:Nk52_evm97s2192 gene=Nk52_evmTU97s2192
MSVSLPPVSKTASSGNPGSYKGKVKKRNESGGEVVPHNSAGALEVRKKLPKANKARGPVFDLEYLKEAELVTEHDSLGVCKYRCSQRYAQSIEILSNGYIQSFIDFFELSDHKKPESEGDAEDNIISTTTEGSRPYEESASEKERLAYVKKILTKSEIAQRTGTQKEVYLAKKAIAEYFNTQGDNESKILFYRKCFDISKDIVDEDQSWSDANLNLALALEQDGQMAVAANYFLTYYELSRDNDWESVGYACEKLIQSYNIIGEELERNGKFHEAIDFHQKCYEMASESGTKADVALVNYRLGKAYENVNDSKSAVSYHKQYLEYKEEVGDDIGQGEACAALARAYQSQGDLNHAIQYLGKFVVLAEKTSQDEARADACKRLGVIYNSQGNYEKAVENFERFYEISRVLNDPESLKEARVQYGIARAHAMLNGYMNSVAEENKTNLNDILLWKNLRVDDKWSL